MSGKIGIWNISTLNRELKGTQVRTSDRMLGSSLETAIKLKEEEAQRRSDLAKQRNLSSAFGKEREYQDAFESGQLEFFPIRAQGENPQSTRAGIQRHYGKKSPLTAAQGKNVANELAFKQLQSLGRIAAGVPFSMVKDYQQAMTKRYLGITNVSKRIPNRNRNFKKFVQELNKLYKVQDGVWQLSSSIVNAVPETAYFIPMKTPTIIPMQAHTMAPLGFSYDPSMQGFRVVYTLTGDPMFSFLYFSPEDALKGREVHKKMMDWSLSPGEINEMYIALYDNPNLYAKVYDLMYEKIWGVQPPFERYAPGILRPQVITPDWVDQRLARNTLLTSIGDLGGLVSNDSYPQNIRKKIIETQNRLKPYISKFMNPYKDEDHTQPYIQRSSYTKNGGKWDFHANSSPELLESIQQAKLLLEQQGV